MLLSISVSTHLGYFLLPWTIIEVYQYTDTLQMLFTTIQGGHMDVVTIYHYLKIIDYVSPM